MTVIVESLTPEDWPCFKSLRLEMLQLAPEAFGSNLARESAFGGEDWRTLVCAFHPIVVKAGAEIAGTAGYLHPFDTDLGRAKIVSMYVRPPFRARGLGRRVLEEILMRVRQNTVAEEVSLDVFAENSQAVELYRSAGFSVHDTAQRGTSLGNPRTEVLMSMPLGQGRGLG